MPKSARSDLSLLTAPLRRHGASTLARYVVPAIGLAAMAAVTDPALRNAAGLWLSICLWCCLAYFAVESATRAGAALLARRSRSAASTAIDLAVVLPVPIALLCGAAPPDAWLFACLWVLRFGQNSSGLAQLGRVVVLEAKALASVLVLFLMVLFLASAAMYALERHGQPAAFGTLPDALWWTVVTLTTTGYGDEVPKTPLGHLLGAMVMICGIATFGLWTGILASGFAAESRRRNFIQTWDLVSKVPFFQSLDPTTITEITHMLRRVEVPERTAVIRRGRVGDCMYFIGEGEVEVHVAPAPVRLGVGTFFGELALLGDSIRTADVTTTRPSTLLILDLADFRTLMAHHAELARLIDEEGKRRLGELERQRNREKQASAAS